MVSDLARSLSPASRQWPTRGYTTSGHASLRRSEGDLSPPPFAAKATKEMSREEVAKYNGAFTLADDGEWYTNMDAPTDAEWKKLATRLREEVAFAEAASEATCVKPGEEASAALDVEQGGDSAREDMAMCREAFAKAKHALATLEAARQGLPGCEIDCPRGRKR